MRLRLAVLTSHPIQYQAPLFRVLASQPGVDFTALFCHDHGVQPTFDPRFGRIIQYDVPLLEGYSYRFLRNLAPRRSLRPMGQFNPEILASLAKGEFDAIVLHGYRALTNLLALAAPRRRARILMRGESHLLQHRTLAKRTAKRAVFRCLFPRIDHFLPIGSLNREYYKSYGVSDDRMTDAPYSVDNQHFAQGSKSARSTPELVRHRLGLPLGLPLILFCGKLISIKRPLDALHAFARVRTQTPCGLVYVGDGALAGELDREVERLGLGAEVHRLGFRNQNELPSIYGACDILVLPSEVEPWGLVVNEAMAAGMTAVVSDHVGAGPDLADTECVFPAGNIDALSEALRRLIAHPDAVTAAKLRAADRMKTWGLSQTAEGFLRGAEAALRA